MQRSVDAVHIEAKSMMHAVPAHAPLPVVLGEIKVNLRDQNVKKVKNEKTTMDMSRMSFASMGCTLSSMRKRLGAYAIKNHVWGMVTGSKMPRTPLAVPPIMPKKYVQMMVHPRPSSTRLIRACKRAAVSVASRSRLSTAAGSSLVVVLARAARQRPRMQATLQLTSHGKTAIKATAKRAGSK